VAVGKLSENLLVEKCSSKNTKYELKPPILGKFRGKIELLRSRNLFCKKNSQLSVEKLQLSVPYIFYPMTPLVTIPVTSREYNWHAFI